MRIRILTSCTGKKAHSPEAQLTQHDFQLLHDPIRFGEREAELRAYRTPAEALYTGLQHVRLMEGVGALREARGPGSTDLWILSAGYGLIHADREIVPYECTFESMRAAEIDTWAKHLRVPDDARRFFAQPADLVLVLLGDDYLRALGLDDHVTYAAPALFFASKSSRKRVKGQGRVRTVILSIPETKQFCCGMAGLKGEVARRVLLRLAEEGEPFLRRLFDPSADVRELLADEEPHPEASTLKVRSLRDLMPSERAAEPARAQIAPQRAPEARLRDVRRLYEILDRVEVRVGGKRRFADCDGRMDWPDRGVYFVFEPAEERTISGRGLRVVRVGTHAVRQGSQTKLWARLRTHRGIVGGAHPGGGNYRGSVFRLYVGTALINRYKDQWPASVTEQWGVGQNAPRSVREREYPVERAVSEYIGQMWVLWVEVDDEPGPDSLRSYIERNAIALLSNYDRQAELIDPASDGWLGHWAASEGVRRSGLWNVDYTGDVYEAGFLDVLERQLG